MRDRDEIIDIIADVYEEYSISRVGFDCLELCKKMGITVKKYSESKEACDLLIRLDEDGISGINKRTNEIFIYYNDNIYPRKRLCFTISHEIGHICLGHHLEWQYETDEMKKEADIFANELYCPQAFMIWYGFTTRKELMTYFGITESYAEVLLDKLRKRESQNLTNSEIRLINIFEKNRKK